MTFNSSTAALEAFERASRRREMVLNSPEYRSGILYGVEFNYHPFADDDARAKSIADFHQHIEDHADLHLITRANQPTMMFGYTSYSGIQLDSAAIVFQGNECFLTDSTRQLVAEKEPWLCGELQQAGIEAVLAEPMQLKLFHLPPPRYVDPH